MSATINIVETTTELGVEVVEVTVTDASAPGPAGPGVPTGGTDGQVLTKASATDYDTAWEDPTGGSGGAPTDADYLVGTAHGDLSAEIVVGTSPGGELGGTWASPTVAATHSGSSHAAVQAAAEATAAAALSAHEGDTTSVHGIADTSVLATDSEVATAVSNHSADTTSVHGIADTSVVMLEGDAAGGVLSGTYPNPGFAADMATQAELDAHLNDAADAHDASAISFTPAGTIAATDVQAAIEEVASEAGGGGNDVHYESRSTNTILGVADKAKTIDITATITQTLEADETLGDGWWVILRSPRSNGSTVVVTIDPAGTETINGATTYRLHRGEMILLLCNGAGGNFNAIQMTPPMANENSDLFGKPPSFPGGGDCDFDGSISPYVAVAGSEEAVVLLETGADVARYDVSTLPSWLLAQVGPADVVELRADYTLADGESVVLALTPFIRPASDNATLALRLNDNDTSSTSGNHITMMIEQDTTEWVPQGNSSADAAGNEHTAVSINTPQPMLFRIIRANLTYHCLYSTTSRSWQPIYSATFASALTNIWIALLGGGAHSGGVPVVSIPWIRVGGSGFLPW